MDLVSRMQRPNITLNAEAQTANQANQGQGSRTRSKHGHDTGEEHRKRESQGN
jgi:hypothetical protein